MLAPITRPSPNPIAMPSHRLPGHRFLLVAACAALLSGGCAVDSTRVPLSSATRAAIADTLQRLLVTAYDITAPDPLPRLLGLYPDTGRVISASGGHVIADRDSVFTGIRAFWTFVGQNMRNPTWTWGPFFVDVLGPDAAVVTATYSVPHHTPAGEPHVVAGAWTAVFARRDGQWRIVQEHLSDAPQPAGAATMPMGGDSAAAHRH